jgi:lysophospholipase L1-like esterase
MIALAAAALAVATAAAELLLRVIVPSPTKYFVLRPGIRQVFHANPLYVRGIEGEAVYEVNADGLRGPPLSGNADSQYRILVVGGSTAENLFLTEDENWPGILQRELPPATPGRVVRVANAGRSGMNARDHVVQVRRLLPQLGHLDLLIVLVGVNDFTVATAGMDHPQPPLTDSAAMLAQERRAFAAVPGPFYAPRTDELLVSGAPWYKGTALYQLAKRAKFEWQKRTHNALISQDPTGMVNQRWRSNRSAATALLDTMPSSLSRAVREFRFNLAAIAAEAGRHQVRLLLLTQPSVWRDSMTTEERRFLWLGGTGDFQAGKGHAYYTPGALRKGIDQFNRATLETCVATGVECLDLATMIPRDTLHFYDDVHYTELGAKRVGEAIVDYLRARPPFHR